MPLYSPALSPLTQGQDPSFLMTVSSRRAETMSIPRAQQCQRGSCSANSDRAGADGRVGAEGVEWAALVLSYPMSRLPLLVSREPLSMTPPSSVILVGLLFSNPDPKPWRAWRHEHSLANQIFFLTTAVIRGRTEQGSEGPSSCGHHPLAPQLPWTF